MQRSCPCDDRKERTYEEAHLLAASSDRWTQACRASSDIAVGHRLKTGIHANFLAVGLCQGCYEISGQLPLLPSTSFLSRQSWLQEAKTACKKLNMFILLPRLSFGEMNNPHIYLCQFCKLQKYTIYQLLESLVQNLVYRPLQEKQPRTCNGYGLAKCAFSLPAARLACLLLGPG